MRYHAVEPDYVKLGECISVQMIVLIMKIFFFLRRIIQTGQNETRYKFAYTMAVPRAVDYIIICLYVDV